MKNYERVSVRFSGYGHYKVRTIYYGKEITFTTNNMSLIDDFKDTDKRGWKTAGEILHKQCVEANYM